MIKYVTDGCRPVAAENMSDAAAIFAGRMARKNTEYLGTLESTFQGFVDAAIKYIDKHGKRQSVIDKLEIMLPGAWAAEIIAEALDEIQAR